MRRVFTPAMAYSTLTRTLLITWLMVVWMGRSSRPRGFFLGWSVAQAEKHPHDFLELEWVAFEIKQHKEEPRFTPSLVLSTIKSNFDPQKKGTP